MDQEAIKSLIAELRRRHGELEGVEAKAAHTGTPADLSKPLSAFANCAGGGILLFGLDEDAGFKVVGVGNPRKLQEDLSVLIAPVEMLAGALNSHLELQRYEILFICGNYSRILRRLDRNFAELEVRRAFTVFQLMTILEENHHSFLIEEHDPLLYEDAGEMVEYLAQALKQTSRRLPSCSTRRLWPPTYRR